MGEVWKKVERGTKWAGPKCSDKMLRDPQAVVSPGKFRLRMGMVRRPGLGSGQGVLEKCNPGQGRRFQIGDNRRAETGRGWCRTKESRKVGGVGKWARPRRLLSEKWAEPGENDGKVGETGGGQGLRQ